VSTNAINLPDVVAEVTAMVRRYEAALFANDVATLNQLFWASEHTLRYGITENLYGHSAISSFRSERKGPPISRETQKFVVTTFGRDFATANVEYRQGDPPRAGRMSHTWVRFREGWRIVAAHVSHIAQPAAGGPSNQSQ
jgi:hypothetical protein